jgi:competence protein ComEC
VAISGLHITILAGILFYLFILLGVPRQKSFWPAVLILFLYVCMIGFRASAIRAFIMGTLVLYALKIGRLSKSINALVLAGAILLLINPKLLLWDVGFQLSFLAVLGILYFYPLLTKTLKHKNTKTQLLNNRFVDVVVSIFFVTLSAQIFTLPLVFYYFRVISLVSPLANLLVLPILPVVMVSGLILIILGLIWSKLAFAFGILIWLLLSYIFKVVELLSQIPFGHFTF